MLLLNRRTVKCRLLAVWRVLQRFLSLTPGRRPIRPGQAKKQGSFFRASTAAERAEEKKERRPEA
jgi:hypothetical protein